MWKTVRIGILLLVLLAVMTSTWLDRVHTQSWKAPLWVGIFPLNADGTDTAQRYIDNLKSEDLRAVETFFHDQAQLFGQSLDEPVRMELYPQGKELPPTLSPGAGPLGVAWWSLKLRWFARQASRVPGRIPPTIRIFVLYHDPSTLPTVPDSHGLQKGLVGVVHAFAVRSMAGSNNIVIAHELMHTLGATDKYDPATGNPLFPNGFGDPAQEPRYPQERAEIMAARRALTEDNAEMPTSLRNVVVGPVTAKEIGWTSH